MDVELYVGGRDDCVTVLRRRSEGWSRQTQVERAGWPTRGPDGRLLVTCLDREDGGQRAWLEVVDGTGERLVVPGSARETFITPRLPMYSCWAPAGGRIAFVASDGAAISLHAWLAGETTPPPAELAAGAPIFHAWHPSGSSVAVHSGQELTLVQAGGGEDSEVVSDGAVGFRVPSWSDDGELLAWARPAEGGVEVLVHQQGEDRRMGRFDGGVALAFRPHSRDLTVAVASQPADGSFDTLHPIETDCGEDAALGRLIRGPFAAFAWSPDGTRVALSTPTQTGDGRYATRVADASGAVIAVSEAIVPSIDTRLTLGFFDQYQLSQPWWSPDSRGIVMCGRLVGDAVSGAFGDPEGSHAFWWPAEPGEPLSIVCPGEVACFAPAAARDVNGE